uniref:AlNc14C346G10857 protein n=1 Tax=Albugo laibachii Nc14 TaxID=890382 RepID=F0WXA4_9STRA|nr:AlNc14C346G10857 [Albugo laibachii Nc14]|eukprot:CCA26096.1 AlNc14C346G10857 [Albugo laibachii Nc14]
MKVICKKYITFLGHDVGFLASRSSDETIKIWPVEPLDDVKLTATTDYVTNNKLNDLTKCKKWVQDLQAREATNITEASYVGIAMLQGYKNTRQFCIFPIYGEIDFFPFTFQSIQSSSVEITFSFRAQHRKSCTCSNSSLQF